MAYDIVFFTDLNTRFYHAKSMGSYRLATELRKHGYTVKVVDFFGKWLQNPKDFFKLLNAIVSDQTLFVGFSATFYTENATKDAKITNWIEYRDYGDLNMWPESTERMSMFLTAIKKLYPQVKLVYGGSFEPGRITSLQHMMDYIIKGLADTTIVELADHLRKKTPLKFMPSAGTAKIVEHDQGAKYFDFTNSVVSYQTEDHVFPGEILPLETSRGCLFKCSFCSYPLLGRKKGDPDYHKNTDTMSKEFKRNFENHGVDTYMFVDDTFNETTDKLENILQAKNNSGIDIKFSCYLRTDLIARFPEQISLLKDLGIQTAFLGIESLYKPSAMAIGKSTDPEKIKETIYKMKESWSNKVKIFGSFIVGLPEDNPSTLETWVPWIMDQSCPIDYPFLGPLGLDFDGISEISRDPMKFGYSKCEQNPTQWKNKYWTFGQARDYSNAVMQHMWNNSRLHVAGWDLIGYQNLGFKTEQLQNLTLDKLDYELLKEKKQQQWEHYKNALFEYELGTTTR